MQRPIRSPHERQALRIGTRGSALALIQARWVAARLADVGVATALEIVRTEGDDRPVDTAWGEGAFVTAIEAALLSGRIDVAVHSAKDVPTDEDPRLVIAAYPPREDPRDALVCRERGTTLATLPHGARVGTDSPRRTAFLLAARPDLRLHPLHGNVDTRLRKLDAGESDALVLAVAGLTRLGRAERIDDILPPDVAAPAPGQGSLAVQVRTDDAVARDAVGRLDDPPTRAAVEAERALLRATGGGCRAPIGALAKVEDGCLTLLAGAARDLPGVARDLPDPNRPTGALERVAWSRASGPVEDRESIAGDLGARVVRLRTRPRALVTRPDAQAGPLVAALGARGVDAVVVPTIETSLPAAGSALDAALAGLEPGTWLVVTSPTGAGAVLGASERVGNGGLTGARLAAVGDATAARLRAGGVEPGFVPSSADGATLGRELPLAAGDRVLLARADIADGALPLALRSRGAVVEEVVAYRTIEGPEASAERLAAAFAEGPIDAVVAASGSALRGLLALAPPGRRAGLLATVVVAIGRVTAAEARALGWRAVAQAGGPTPDAIADALTAVLLPAAAGPMDPSPPVSAGEPR